MKMVYLMVIMSCLVFVAVGQESSKPIPAKFFSGDWVSYVNGPAHKLIMHLRLDSSGVLSGSIDSSDGPTMPMTNIHMLERGFTFAIPQIPTVTIVAADDGKRLIGMTGAWERVTDAAGAHACAKAKPESLHLDSDVQRLLDGSKLKSSAEANKELWCSSAADIDELKEVLIPGSVAELRALRRAQVNLDELTNECPKLPPVATPEQSKAYSDCETRIVGAYQKSLKSLEEKMKSLVPPDTFPPSNVVEIVLDVVPLIKEQAQAEERAGERK